MQRNQISFHTVDAQWQNITNKHCIVDYEEAPREEEVEKENIKLHQATLQQYTVI